MQRFLKGSQDKLYILSSLARLYDPGLGSQLLPGCFAFGAQAGSPPLVCGCLLSLPGPTWADPSVPPWVLPVAFHTPVALFLGTQYPTAECVPDNGFGYSQAVLVSLAIA